LSRRARHAEGLAQALRMLGEMLFGLRRHEEALPLLEEAAQLFAQLEDPAAEVAMCRRTLAIRNALGIREWTHGRYAEALTHYEAALRLVRAQGDRVREGLILNSLGVTLPKLHRFDEARAALDASVALNRETGERLLEAHALAALGQLSRTLEQPDRAAQYFGQSLELRRAVGDRAGEGWMLHRIAEARAALGDHETARDAADAAARIAAETGDAELTAASTLPRPARGERAGVRGLD
jgi:tetratricopeptide (TPR) repeat protein